MKQQNTEKDLRHGQESTTRLEKALQEVESIKEAGEFAAMHSVEGKRFYQLFNEYVAENDLDIVEIYELSGISRNYVYNITSGKTKRPGRDKLIALCVAGGMTAEELNRTLRTCGENALYPKSTRDIYISAYANNGTRSVIRLNTLLDEAGLEPLNV